MDKKTYSYLKLKIAIDGPSASGKSSAAEQLSKLLCYVRIEAGSFYRAVTYLVLQKYGRPVDQTEPGFDLFLESIDVKVVDGTIVANNKKLKDELRTNSIDAAIGLIAKQPLVRKKVAEFEHRTINSYEGGIVMDGRVIGTVIMPNADIKFFITASPEVRAERRNKQQKELKYEDVLRDIKNRDYEDENRKIDPLKRAEDAILLKNDEMSLDETVKFMLEQIQLKFK